MTAQTVSEYPLFQPSSDFVILEKWKGILPGERTWRLAVDIRTDTLFACAGFGTMQQYYCLEEAVRLKTTPERVKRELLLTYLGKESSEAVGPSIDICSVARTRRESDLPF